MYVSAGMVALELRKDAHASHSKIKGASSSRRVGVLQLRVGAHSVRECTRRSA